MKISRLPAEKRRQSILKAVTPLFARHGLNGVTTRQLASAAGVSEALLYRHFSNKNTLFAAATQVSLQHSGLDEILPADLPASTRRLVLTVHRLAEHFTSANNELAIRQLGYSLLGDGQLAHTHLTHVADELILALQDDLHAACQAGDLEPGPDKHIESWLLHHLFLGLQMTNLPQRTAPAYRCPRFELLQRSVRFALRGLGLHESVINREYRPERL